MHKITSKSFIKILIREFNSKLEKFKFVKANSMYFDGNDFIFSRKEENGINLILIIRKHHNGSNSFTVEIGWSNKNELPKLSMRPLMYFVEDKINNFLRDEYICRLGDVINGNDKWWMYKNQDELTIKLTHAVDDIVKYGIPFLREYLQFSKS